MNVCHHHRLVFRMGVFLCVYCGAQWRVGEAKAPEEAAAPACCPHPSVTG